MERLLVVIFEFRLEFFFFCVVKYVVKKVKGLELRMVSGDSEYYMCGYCISGGK